MRYLLALLAACIAGTGAFAQPQMGTGDYTSLSLEAGSFRGSFDGTIERLSGGAKITLRSNSAGVPPLPIQANTMTFDWPAGQGTPNAILMEGGVEIRHPQATVTAQRAEWSFEKGTLVFTGNPVMSNEFVKEMRGESMVLDFNTGGIDVVGVSVREMPLNMPRTAGGGAAADPSLLAESDITDLTGLLGTLKTQARADAPSPGRQLFSQLDADMQGVLLNTPTENLVGQKSLIVTQLNGVLRGPGLYNEAAFAGVALDARARELLDASSRTPEEQTRLNRLLLSAAYPDYVRGV